MYLARHLWIVLFKDNLVAAPYRPTPQEALPRGNYYPGCRQIDDVLPGKVLSVTFDKVTVADWLFGVTVPGVAVAVPPAEVSLAAPPSTVSACTTMQAMPVEVMVALSACCVSGGAVVSAPAPMVGVGFPAPSVLSGVTIDTIPLLASASLHPPQVYVLYGVEVRAPPLAASTLALTPSVSAGAVVQAVSANSAISATQASAFGSATALAVPLVAVAGVISPGVSTGVSVAVPAFSTAASLYAPLVSVTKGSAVVVVPAFGVAATALPPSTSGSASAVPPVMIVASGLPAPDVHAATTVLANAALSQALALSPAVAGSGNVIAPVLEAGGIFVAPAHTGGLTSIFYELILNESAVYALVAVDGITYVLPLNPEVVINLVQRN